MRKKNSYGTSEWEEAPINLTPLIDVVFVVLIMFIIIAPMLEIDKVQLATGPYKDEKKAHSVQESSQINIHVKSDNSVWYNSKKVSFEELKMLLSQAKRSHPQKTPQLFHDKKAEFGTYQNVKNIVEGAGFEQMDVILLPNSSKM
jgi:biopolymer transport protein ExbD